jgi:hypothetical protein
VALTPVSAGRAVKRARSAASGVLESKPAKEQPGALGPAMTSHEQMGLLWEQLQKQMLDLLAHGIAEPFQQRAFDKLDYSMKHYARFQRERGEELRSAHPAEPDAEELAVILKKIDRRIDELAEDRFKKLAGGKLPAHAMEAGSAGMDV